MRNFLLGGLLFATLTTSSLSSFAEMGEGDSKMYMHAAIIGLYSNKETATLHTDVSWIESGSPASAKKTFTVKLDSDTTLGALASFGYTMSGGYTLEGNLAYYKLTPSVTNDSTDSKLFAMPHVDAHLNALMPFSNGTQFTPYVGIGIGLSAQEIDLSDYSYSVDLNDSQVGGSGSGKTYNVRNTFHNNASGDQLTSEWKFGAIWQIFGGMTMELIPDQVSLVARVACGSTFPKIKFTSSSDESIYVLYRPLNTTGSMGISVHF